MNIQLLSVHHHGLSGWPCGARSPVRWAVWAALWWLIAATSACGSDGAAGASGGDADVSAAGADGAADGAADGSAANGGAADGSAADGSAANGGAADGLAIDDSAADDAGGAAGGGAETFAIGAATFEVVGAEGRKLPVEIWYPSVPFSATEVATYAGGLAPSPFGAIRNAKPLPGKRKLIVFSHGNGGLREQSVFLTEWLARHGFVVVSPEHVGNAFWNMDDKLAAAMVLWRPEDVRRTVDHLAKGAQGKDPAWLGEVADTTSYAVMGHSFGGYTALAVAGLQVRVPPAFKVDCTAADAPQPTCDAIAAAGPQPWQLGDPRCVLAVPLAPAGYGWKMLDKVSANAKLPPIVVVGATGDTLTPAATEQTPLYDDLPGPAALLLVQGSNHYVFSDICALEPVLPAEFKKQLGNMCSPSAQPPVSAVHALVAERALLAARRWLLGDTTAAAALVAPVPDGFSFEHKGIVD